MLGEVADYTCSCPMLSVDAPLNGKAREQVRNALLLLSRVGKVELARSACQRVQQLSMPQHDTLFAT